MTYRLIHSNQIADISIAPRADPDNELSVLLYRYQPELDRYIKELVIRGSRLMPGIDDSPTIGTRTVKYDESLKQLATVLTPARDQHCYHGNRLLLQRDDSGFVYFGHPDGGVYLFQIAPHDNILSFYSPLIGAHRNPADRTACPYAVGEINSYSLLFWVFAPNAALEQMAQEQSEDNRSANSADINDLYLQFRDSPRWSSFFLPLQVRRARTRSDRTVSCPQSPRVGDSIGVGDSLQRDSSNQSVGSAATAGQPLDHNSPRSLKAAL